VAEWLSQIPEGPSRESAIHGFLDGAAQSYPEYATQWTQGIADDQTRWEYQLIVAPQWIHANAEAARTWVDSQNWPESFRQRLEEEIRE
jgi:hypothetical protein